MIFGSTHRIRPQVRSTVLGFLVLVAGLTPSWAQETAIRGRVKDQTGSGTPGVTVSVFDEAGRLVAQAVSGEEGRYALPALRPGKYSLRVALKGFEPLERPMAVGGPATLEVDLDLKLAQLVENVVVTSREDSLLRTADSAGQGTTGASDLADRPLLRSGEVLETVPGVIITQHAGGGKANQYFLRGFNLDHGTDFAVFLDDMPLNLPSHAHGEGYSDMNVVIPELIQTVNFEKGPYYADVGNFGSAGAAHIQFSRSLPQDFVSLQGGQYGFARLVLGASTRLGAGELTLGGEASHDDGPWTHPDGYSKFNGLATYSQGDATSGLSVTALGYHGRWNSSDQIPASFGATSFFGTLNPTDGGESERYGIQAEWHRQDSASATRISLYGFLYDLDLFSDFTYFLTDPTLGDQFEQQDRRSVAGLDLRHSRFGNWGDRPSELTFGLQVRNDWITNGLYQSADRVRVDKVDSDSGMMLPATTQAHRFTDTVAGAYVQAKVQWTPTLRSVAAFRADLDYFDVTSLSSPANSGTSLTVLPSPKLSLIAGPWAHTEVYLQGGFGFHSNDGRGTTQTIQPISGENPYPDTPAEKIPGLIQTKGAEVGVRTLAIPHLQSTVSLWYLHSDSELQQSGDTGGTVASKQPSNRWGVEFANFFTPSRHVALDLDVADSRARFTSIDADDAAPSSRGGTRVPEAVGWVVAAGATIHDVGGFSSSLRLRYFGPRDLTSDGLYRSRSTLLLNAQAAFHFHQRWSVSVEVLNLLNRRDHDIDYAYLSRAAPTASPAFENVFHPVEPIQLRVGFTAQFARKGR